MCAPRDAVEADAIELGGPASEPPCDEKPAEDDPERVSGAMAPDGAPLAALARDAESCTATRADRTGCSLPDNAGAGGDRGTPAAPDTGIAMSVDAPASGAAIGGTAGTSSSDA